MKIILIMGLVYIFSLVSFVQGYVAPRDENHVPASVICDRNGNFVVIIGSSFWVRASTGSTIQIYYDGKIAKVDTDGWLQVETSTDSRTQIYYGTSPAIVRDGSTDNNLPSEKGLLTQSNLHAYNANKWHRLLGEATNYHNLRVALFENGRILSINDFDSDNQAEGRDGIIVYSYLSGWDEVNDNWDRARMDEMKNLKVILGSNSVIGALLDSVTVYMNLSQFEELTKHTTVYLTESQWKSLKEETTTFINVSQVADLKIVSLPDGTTVYLTESQLKSLKEKTTTYVENFPSDYPDSTAQSSLSSIDTNMDGTYNQLKSSVPVFYKVAESTYVYKKDYENGSITVGFHVKAISCYAQGGDATLLWDLGDAIDIWEGIPFNDVPIDDTFSKNVTFTYTLSVPTTFSLYIRGIPYE